MCGWIGGDPPSAVHEAARERTEQGFTAVKMNATGELYNFSIRLGLSRTM
jgi:L-alanine-DL-glutamate epimerase-like enolase superfamily enzyme